MSIEQLERNREIRDRKLRGESYSDIAKDYNLSVARIRQINAHVRLIDRSNIKEIPEIKLACEQLCISKWLNGRIQTALRVHRLNIRNRWRKLSRKDILKIPNIGERAADIIEYAQKL